MEVAIGFLQEIRTLLEDARRYLSQAEDEDPFTRDDTLQYASRSLRTAWTVYNRLGAQISRVTTQAAKDTLLSDQLKVKTELEELGNLIDVSKVASKPTGFSPAPATHGQREYHPALMSSLCRQEDELKRAKAQAHAALETGADLLDNLNAQKETIEHARAGGERAEEAFFEGILAAKRIKRTVDKHRIIMTTLLSVLGVGTLTVIIVGLLKR
ncbi:Qb-SNARE 1 [Giardia duodenalis]|uniref:Qb-SNARE 1 n=1 Tax=Giardia intestinalis (strain ATCC 50803 / WB clone C6) TaxID=184922 RepID=A8B6B8_GIAIC|nr:Qb-SNARE 1 [Giardia intestinalis]KAE8304997.1 Qb-SNARE 1 [Giardia intestinalis]|eukprot:XP_001709432.1 Hypothetical protein GL50803_16054 [Giardia lamblia ATCC 50803]